MVVPPRWLFPGRLVRVIDGDTISVVLRLNRNSVDLGFRIWHKIENEIEVELRLRDVRAPEMTGADKPRGIAAKAECISWLTEAGNADWPLVVETFKPRPETLNRYLAIVTRVNDGRSLNDDLNNWLDAHGGAGGR